MKHPTLAPVVLVPTRLGRWLGLIEKDIRTWGRQLE
jgi:hypothetical protein